jgi:hypothetical protein
MRSHPMVPNHSYTWNLNGNMASTSSIFASKDLAKSMLDDADNFGATAPSGNGDCLQLSPSHGSVLYPVSRTTASWLNRSCCYKSIVLVCSQPAAAMGSFNSKRFTNCVLCICRRMLSHFSPLRTYFVHPCFIRLCFPSILLHSTAHAFNCN